MTSKPVKVFEDEKGRLYIKNKKGKKTYIRTSLTKDAVQKNFIKEWKKSKIKKTRTKKPKKLYRTKPITKKEINRSGDTSSSAGPSALDRQVAESKKPPAIGQKDVLYITVGEKNDMALQEAKKIQDITLKIMESKNINALLHDTSRNDTTSQLAYITSMGDQLNRRLMNLEYKAPEIIIEPNTEPHSQSKAEPKAEPIDDPSANQLRKKPEYQNFRDWNKKTYKESLYNKDSRYVYNRYNEYKKSKPTVGVKRQKFSSARSLDTLRPEAGRVRIEEIKTAEIPRFLSSDTTVEQLKKFDDVFSEFNSPPIKAPKKEPVINLEPITQSRDVENLKKIQELEAKVNRLTPLAKANVEQLRKDRDEERKKQRELRDLYLEDVKTSKKSKLSDSSIQGVNIEPLESKLSDSSIQGVSIEPLDLDNAMQKISDIQSFLQAFDQPSTSDEYLSQSTPSDFGLTIEIPESTYGQQSLSTIETPLSIPEEIPQQGEPKLESVARSEIASPDLKIASPDLKIASPDLKIASPRQQLLVKDLDAEYRNNDVFRAWLVHEGIGGVSAFKNKKGPGMNKLWYEYVDATVPLIRNVPRMSDRIQEEIYFLDTYYNTNYDFQRFVETYNKPWDVATVKRKTKLYNMWRDLPRSVKSRQYGSGDTSIIKIKDLYPDESLYESEIQKLFKEENYQFLPVIAHNEIHKIKLNKRKPTFFVMNLSDRGESGTHWISTYINEKGNIYYFDSFGRPPDKETKDQLSDLFEQNGDGTNMLRRLKYNTRSVQNPLSSDCGFFAIQFVENMLDGKSFRNSVNITEEDLKDEKIHTKEWM